MHERAAKHLALAAILSSVVLILGCGPSAESVATKDFLAKFDKIVEQNRALDDLEKKGDEYNQQLEKVRDERQPSKRAVAIGAWIGQYKSLLSQARSIVDTQSGLVDDLVTDSAKLSADANRYSREATDALREYIATERKGIELSEQLMATLESSVSSPATADPKRVEELTNSLNDLDSKEKQVFQQAQDAAARLRAVAPRP